MQPITLLGCGALLCALVLFPPPSTAHPAPEEPTGHLVLVVEGDATALRVTAAVPKADPFGGVPKGLRSDWSLSIRDARGRELGRYPLDLSSFDLDPARVGKPLTVEGCIVRDTKVGLLVNVPDFPGADRMEFWHGVKPRGSVPSAQLAELRRGGGR